ncbi:hypothetical protein ACS0TY_025881 [Phlomoides rotata]
MKKSVPSIITNIKARQILDSRGIPTVEFDLYTIKGVICASTPISSTSAMYEAIELRDGDEGTYHGNNVSRVVSNNNEKISEALVGMDPTLQVQIDQAMIDLDKTDKNGEVGANAILAVSMTACRAGAAEKGAASMMMRKGEEKLSREFGIENEYYIGPDQIEALYQYVKFQFECGNYFVVADYLYQYRTLCINSEMSLSALWVKLAA